MESLKCKETFNEYSTQINITMPFLTSLEEYPFEKLYWIECFTSFPHGIQFQIF